MKTCNIRNTLGEYLLSKVHICDAKIAYLDNIANLENLSLRLMVCTFQKSCHVDE